MLGTKCEKLPEKMHHNDNLGTKYLVFDVIRPCLQQNRSPDAEILSFFSVHTN